MWTLSAFADEISPDLDVQLATLAAEEIRYIEFRGVWNKNVLDLSDAEIERVKAALAERGVGVSSIGSPIGKIRITDDFAPHLERFRRALGSLSSALRLDSPVPTTVVVRTLRAYFPPLIG